MGAFWHSISGGILGFCICNKLQGDTCVVDTDHNWSRNVQSSSSQNSHVSKSLGGLVKTHVTGPTTRVSDSLHFSEVPGWCRWYWPSDHTLRTPCEEYLIRLCYFVLTQRVKFHLFSFEIRDFISFVSLLGFLAIRLPLSSRVAPSRALCSM